MCVIVSYTATRLADLRMNIQFRALVIITYEYSKDALVGLTVYNYNVRGARRQCWPMFWWIWADL